MNKWLDRLSDMSLDIRDLRSESRRQFYWTIGLIITLLVAVVMDILMRSIVVRFDARARGTGFHTCPSCSVLQTVYKSAIYSHLV